MCNGLFVVWQVLHEYVNQSNVDRVRSKYLHFTRSLLHVFISVNETVARGLFPRGGGLDTRFAGPRDTLSVQDGGQFIHF